MAASALARPWGALPTGEDVDLVTLRTPEGAEARVTSMGATLVGLDMPDGAGGVGPVVAGVVDPRAWEADTAYRGRIVGRYANRIRHGRFELDGRGVDLVKEGTHQLHGGPDGFDRRRWTRSALDADGREARVEFTLVSPDGDMGFPGELTVAVEYRLRDTTLSVAFRAVTDAPTHVNLTNHAYFDLDGRERPLDQSLAIAADEVLCVDEDRLVTGERRPVAGTAFDLRRPRRLDEALADPRGPGGFDHSWLVRGWAPPPELREAAVLRGPRSRRRLRVATTSPAVHVFTAPDLGGVALETQFPADAPNHPEWPSTRLDPGDVWRHETRFAFDVESP